MSKHTQKTYVFLEYKYSADYLKQEWVPRLWCFKADDTDARVFVCESTSEFEMPDGFDPVSRQIAALESAKAEALTQYQSRVGELNNRLAKLQAITYESETA
jgi:hypothetical protein